AEADPTKYRFIWILGGSRLADGDQGCWLPSCLVPRAACLPVLFIALARRCFPPVLPDKTSCELAREFAELPSATAHPSALAPTGPISARWLDLLSRRCRWPCSGGEWKTEARAWRCRCPWRRNARPPVWRSAGPAASPCAKREAANWSAGER